MEGGSSQGRPEVVIVGGGIAGLEALLAITDLAGDAVAVTLVAPDIDFTYKPWIVKEPFTPEPAQRLALAPLVAERGGRFVQQAVAGVRPGEHAIELADGSELSYDAAILCVGARSRPPYSRGVTMMLGSEFRIDDLLGGLDPEQGGTIGFVVPPGVTWPLPIYELAMMTESLVRERRIAARLIIVTPEEAPLIVFGRIASDAVAGLLSGRGIEVRTGTSVQESDGRLVTYPGQDTLEVDQLIALAAYDGPGIRGLPADERGFIPIDDYARVVGAEDLYAAGDGTNFPIKQGGIGTQEADAAAEHIAARFGALDGEPQPFHPVLRGKLVTGEESLHLREEVAGGAGEGIASLDYLWWPPHKVSGRYLAPFLMDETPHAEPEPPAHSLDVEVSLPREWHREPMALDPYGSPDA